MNQPEERHRYRRQLIRLWSAPVKKSEEEEDREISRLEERNQKMEQDSGE